MLAPGLIVSAAKSGAGKTVVTTGLQRAFARTGLKVAGAKCGPDYIDPAFHAVATGRPSLNLDGFALELPVLAGLAAHSARDAEVVIGEGAMGLYDGLASPTRSGTTASVATALGWPILLVLDASGAAQSIAAVALGLARMPGAPRIAGVIVNRAASPRHRRMIEAGFAAVDIPIFGMIPADPRMALPSRHLGLVQASETTDLDIRLNRIADVVEAHCDLPAIHAAAGPTIDAPLPSPTVRPPGQRIAVAQDAAFTFMYPHLLQGWRRAGAEIVRFSPLADQPPPAICDACWLPGGYPELHAGTLAGNARFLHGLRDFAATRPVHGECGGYMVLGQTLTDADGAVHPMAGLLPVETSFAARKLHLGYRSAIWSHSVAFAEAGVRSWGHEYHHATICGGEAGDLAAMTDGEGVTLSPAGHRRGLASGTFFHVIA
ncbi:cobyrinate a,c-diamide synthase [Sphingomonas xinjiangensis]|uniref:Cobyrinate a,c-diamide synthase n=1 Tax=Sphingomonas xinjiangensis TaxID=643568 RepID=A0A840YJ30_9SPHN|nr:cobyrinate a,c-diamide synthase [Sphingomonas xinjiangensis]MBB5710938.1 cobyrinic acid a,c-diamide synthase [Sphingomonas xinjiangensis]